jgi:protein-S-isoprenylcysteine O-methyltransferase Ste14
MGWRHDLALFAILPAGATFYFFAFWRWFDFFRKHRVLTYAFFLGTFVVLGAAVESFRSFTFAAQLVMPLWAQWIGGAVLVASTLFGTLADRQIGLHVRTFAPFFEKRGRIELQTTGAYGVVRHPIYAAGSWFQLGAFLIAGYPSVLVSWLIFTLGALWFTRQEETRLMQLLDDPRAYERYRERVPALFPRFGRRSSESREG